MFAFGPDGHLYVPDLTLEQTRSFNGTTGRLQQVFTQGNPSAESPAFDIVFGPDGNAYTPTSERIFRYDGETGQYIDTFVDGAGGSIGFFPPEGPATDLAVIDLQVPPDAIQRTDISVTYTVRNDSVASVAMDEWFDVVYLSSDDQFDPLDQQIGRVQHTGGLAGGASYTETLTGPLPTVPLGGYRIFVFADRRGQVFDTDRANNLRRSTDTVEVMPRPASPHDADQTIAVGRTLSAYSTADVTNGGLRITYTVYNLTDGYAHDVRLTTTLQPDVTLTTASQVPVQNGQELTWSLGTITPLGHVSVELAVLLTTSAITQIDAGPEAFATVDATAFDDSLGAAVLRTDAIDPALLAATLDANSSDPWIQAKAAELNQDTEQIFRFMTQHVQYESYTGSLRGSRGTLWSSAGNALDQASLFIALLRASGVPAQYASGTLSNALAQDLIVSMFPGPQVITGFVDPGSVVSDPKNDANLLAETRDHHWVQLDVSGVMRDADPTFFEAVIGQSFAAVNSSFSEVPDVLRHHVDLRLQRELTTPAVGLFGGGSGQDMATVFEARFSTAELVGRPVTVGFFVQSNTLASPIFVSTTNVYSPYLLVAGSPLAPGDDETIRGTDFAETLTNYPFGSQILTGLFLNIDVSTPGGQTETWTTTIADRIGPAVRANGGSVASASGSQPLVTFADLTTLNILPSDQSRAAVVRDNVEIENLAAGFGTLMASILSQASNADRDAHLAAASRNLTDLLVAASRARLCK